MTVEQNTIRTTVTITENQCAKRGLDIDTYIFRKKKAGFKRKDAERLVNLSKGDSKKFWKERKGSNRRKENAKCYFYNHFKTLAQKEMHIEDAAWEEIDLLEDKDIENAKVLVELDAEITVEELETSIKEQ